MNTTDDGGAFWEDLNRDLEDPAFRRAFEAESARIKFIDALVNALASQKKEKQ